MKDVIHLYSQLLAANQDAFAQQLFTVAYHSLSGAMSCACYLKDPEKLAEVERLANEQFHEIYVHVSQRAHHPLELTLYDSLGQIARARRILFLNGSSI